MSDHIDNWLAAWVRGDLSEERERRLHEHVDDCERCAEKFAEAKRDFAAMATDSPEPEPPDRGLRERIMGDLEPGARFEDLVGDVADLLDIDPEQACELLAAVDEESNWVEVPGQDVGLLYLPFVGIEPGKTAFGRLQTVLRVDRGGAFPEHTHHGRERVFVLQGELVEADGRRFGRGEMITHDDGSSHHFEVPAESPELVGLALIERDLEIGGIPIADLLGIE